jgi:5'-nucleotidase
VTVVAPSRELSGCAHSISLKVPVFIEEQMDERTYVLSGSPADCVKVAVLALLPEQPDLVVAGINLGANVGVNVLYSGTVAAALEGAIFGIPSAAVSLLWSPEPDFSAAAHIATNLIGQMLQAGAPERVALNINIPARAAKDVLGVRVAPQCPIELGEAYRNHTESDGRSAYTLTYGERKPVIPPESDWALLRAGCVTLTPLRPNLTSEEWLGRLSAMDWQV